MNTTWWIILGVVNLPVYFGLGWMIFKDIDDFWESFRFWLTPDIFSAFRGEFWDDWWGELKLGVWIALCGGCVAGEAFLIEKMLG
jgi:hypothetical protein